MTQLAIWPGQNVDVLPALDAILDLRVALHQAREEHAIGVPLYLHGLRVVRDIENVLEGSRGPVDCSRAFELACIETGRLDLLHHTRSAA